MEPSDPTTREMADWILSGGLLRGDELVEPKLAQVGRYRVRALIGEGAAGQVYLAEDPGVGRLVAIKILDRGVAKLERFQRELTVLGQLEHGGIVTIYDAGMHEGRPYYVMEHAAGQSLADAELPPREAVKTLRDVALACHAAHQEGIVHRDLKPGNILLGNRPMVADFGIAKVFDADLTETGQVLGTPNYMAPEQVASGPVDARTDVHAIGVMLYEVITGQLPYRGNSLVELFINIERHDPVRPSKIQPGTHRDLETICMAAMAKEPGGRYPTAQALADDLSAWLEGRPIAGRRPGRWPAPLRRPVVWGAAALVVLLLLVGGQLARRQPSVQPAPKGVEGSAAALVQAEAQARVYDALLDLERWETNLFRRTEKLSYARLEQVVLSLQAVLDRGGLSPELLNEGRFAIARAHLLMGRDQQAWIELTAAIEVGVGPRIGQCYFERARMSWESFMRAELEGNRGAASKLKQRIAADLASSLEAGLEDVWLREFVETLHGLILASHDRAVSKRALETFARLRQVSERPTEEVAKFTGDIYLIAARSDKAITEYTWAIERRYHYRAARNGLALAHLFAGKGMRSVELAFQEAIKAIRINPHYQDSYWCFTLLCRRVLTSSAERVRRLLKCVEPSFLQMTLSVLREGTLALPKSEAVWLTYGYACMLRAGQQMVHKQNPTKMHGAVIEALLPLSRSKDERMRHGALLGLGMVALLQARWAKVVEGGVLAEARDFFEQARYLAPRDAAVYYWIGWQRFLAGEYQQAIDAWEEARRLQPLLKKELSEEIAKARRRKRK